jgi:hypothetical protein
MGSAGLRMEQGRQGAYRDLAKQKTKFLLRIKGYSTDDENHKTSKFVPFQSKDEINEEIIDYHVKDYQSFGNVFEGLELYSVSTNPVLVSKKLLQQLQKKYKT